jgi:hypothetical protein
MPCFAGDPALNGRLETNPSANDRQFPLAISVAGGCSVGLPSAERWLAGWAASFVSSASTMPAKRTAAPKAPPSTASIGFEAMLWLSTSFNMGIAFRRNDDSRHGLFVHF